MRKFLKAVILRRAKHFCCFGVAPGVHINTLHFLRTAVYEFLRALARGNAVSTPFVEAESTTLKVSMVPVGIRGGGCGGPTQL